MNSQHGRRIRFMGAAAEAVMGSVERVRIKPSSAIGRDWQLPPDAEGTVICRYRLTTRCATRVERLDVKFAGERMIWGGPADEFEVVSAQPQTAA
jgi:hypothetical protein